MTSHEKLQQLFQAALAAPEEPVKPTRAFPAAPQPPVTTPVPVIQPVFEAAAPAEAMVEETPRPMANAGLSHAEAEELGQLLDEQNARVRRKRRRDALVAFGVFFGLSGGGFAWFIQSPARVQAAREAVRDVRSVGDISKMVSQYQLALKGVAARSNQIDQATRAMGVSSDQSAEEDPYFEKEMDQMAGSSAGEGKTVGQRNQQLQKSFGSMQKKTDPAASPKAEKPTGPEFEWK